MLRQAALFTLAIVAFASFASAEDKPAVKASAADTAAYSSPGIDALTGKDSPLKEGDRIAFLGDSITQGGAGKNGYLWLIEESLKERQSAKKIELVKAGISGHKVPDLQKRLERDVTSKKPSIVFIYIGINDVWHSQNGKGTPKDAYEAGLHDIIKRIKDAGAIVVLATPTVIGEKHDGSNKMDAMLEEYAEISRKVAKEDGVLLCDLRKAFIDTLKEKNKDNKDRGILTGDTVHLNNEGNKLVADRCAASLAEALKARK
jgi:lysophospholipase L1-like esterase